MGSTVVVFIFSIDEKRYTGDIKKALGQFQGLSLFLYIGGHVAREGFEPSTLGTEIPKITVVYRAICPERVSPPRDVLSALPTRKTTILFYLDSSKFWNV